MRKALNLLMETEEEHPGRGKGERGETGGVVSSSVQYLLDKQFPKRKRKDSAGGAIIALECKKRVDDTLQHQHSNLSDGVNDGKQILLVNERKYCDCGNNSFGEGMDYRMKSTINNIRAVHGKKLACIRPIPGRRFF